VLTVDHHSYPDLEPEAGKLLEDIKVQKEKNQEKVE
jgi:hypothetical protein